MGGGLLAHWAPGSPTVEWSHSLQTMRETIEVLLDAREDGTRTGRASAHVATRSDPRAACAKLPGGATSSRRMESVGAPSCACVLRESCRGLNRRWSTPCPSPASYPAASMRRLSSQLPISIALVLLGVVSAVSWFAYRDLRAVTLRSGSQRLEDVSRQLAGLLGQSAMEARTTMRQYASDTTLIRALRESTVSAAVRARLDDLRQSNAQVDVVELWDAAGTSLVQVRRTDSAPPPPGPDTFPRWLTTDTVGISGFGSEAEQVWFDIATSIRSGAEPIGFLVQRRVLTATPTGVQALSDLIGMEASILVGDPTGIWTDLSRVAQGPSDVATGSGVEYRGHTGMWRVGAGTAVSGTPWMTWVSSPRSIVMARADDFLTRIAPIAALFVIAGGIGAWLVIRSLTAPLQRLTGAATAVANGSYTERVPVVGPDELSQLSGAFNLMAERVQRAQQELEGRVAERTAALRASEDQFRSVAITSRDTIIMADEDGVITYFNPGAEQTFAYDAREVIGHSLTTLMPERFRDGHRRGFARYIATGESNVLGRTIELTGRRKDGSEFPLELSLSSWDRNGGLAFAGIIRDITHRKESEDALRLYASQLEAANEELEAFAYSVSHDLRAPLRAVHGYCAALSEEFAEKLGPVGDDYIRRVTGGVERMGQLIDDLLELSRVTRTAMTRDVVELDTLSDDIINDLRAHADRRVECRVDRGLRVTGDNRLIRLLMQNLLQNAWKFTSNEKHARIEVGAVPEEPGTFYVRDNGAGFDMTYADKLFGVFERLHRSNEFPGTGVGLAIVHRIVMRHGGSIWARGELNRGATFYFKLPSP